MTSQERFRETVERWAQEQGRYQAMLKRQGEQAPLSERVAAVRAELLGEDPALRQRVEQAREALYGGRKP